MRIGVILVLMAIASPASGGEYVLGPEGKPRPDTNNTVWDAYCPDGTAVISGTCVSEAGAIALQNFGPEPGNNLWACAWTKSMTKADVHAMCAK